MSRDSVFRFRLTAEEAERLENEASERGVTKADRIREALGWGRSERARPTAKPRPRPKREKPTVDPNQHPGLAAMQELAKRLKGPP